MAATAITLAQPAVRTTMEVWISFRLTIEFRPGLIAKCFSTLERLETTMWLNLVNARISTTMSFFAHNLLRNIPYFWLTIVVSMAPRALYAQELRPVAILIANSHYKTADSASYSNVSNMELLGKTLANDGFEVRKHVDADKKVFNEIRSSVLPGVSKGQAVLLYFGGIAIAVAGQPFLIPADATIRSEDDVKSVGFDLNSFLDDLHSRGASAQIVILSLPAENALEKHFRDWSTSVPEVISPPDTLAFYVKEPAERLNGKRTGPDLFAKRFVERLQGGRVGAEDALTRTRIAVAEETQGEQNPLLTSSMVHPFVFEAAGRPSTGKNAAPQATPDAKTKSLATDTSRADDKPSEAAAPAGRQFRDCPDCPDLTVIDAGEFKMGSGSSTFDRPVHRVVIGKPFAMAVTDVTFGSWRLCVSESGCKHQVDGAGYDKDGDPVVNVSWLDAKDYVAWLSKKAKQTYRLPTEAEWEYAARGGTTSAYAWGSTIGSMKANCAGCGDGASPNHPTPVKTFPPNGYGLYDMAGNVAEWVEDCWHGSYHDAPSDGSAWMKDTCDEHVQRGGSFTSAAADVKPTARFHYDADVAYYANGFRVARDVTPSRPTP